MKRCCLILLFVFAVAAADERESIDRVVNAFKEGVKEFRFPAAITRNVHTYGLIGDLTEAAADILEKNLKEYNNRIYMLQMSEAAAIESTTDQLIRKMSQYSLMSRPNLVEEELKKINDLINGMNNAEPQIKHYILPKISQSEKEQIETFDGNESSSEIFKNLPNLVVRNMRSIIPLFHNLFFAGMEKAIPKITEFNNELRTSYLQPKLIPLYLEQIDKLNKHKNRFVNHVSRDTYENYIVSSGVFLRKVRN